MGSRYTVEYRAGFNETVENVIYTVLDGGIIILQVEGGMYHYYNVDEIVRICPYVEEETDG